MKFIALKYHFLAQRSISDNNSKENIFSDKIFFMDILLKLSSNRDQPKKRTILLKNIIFNSAKNLRELKQGQNIL